MHDAASTDESYPVFAIPARPVHNKLVFGLATGQVLDQIRARIIGYRLSVDDRDLRGQIKLSQVLCRGCAGSPASCNKVPHCDGWPSGFFEKVLGGTAVWADPARWEILKLDAGVDFLRAVTDGRVVHVSTHSANPLLHDSSSLCRAVGKLSLIHISEPTRLGMISYAVFCLKKKKKTK